MRSLMYPLLFTFAATCPAIAQGSDFSRENAFHSAVPRAHTLIAMSEKLQAHFDAELWSLSNTKACYSAAADMHFGSVGIVQLARTVLQELERKEFIGLVSLIMMEEIFREALIVGGPVDRAFHSCKK